MLCPPIHTLIRCREELVRKLRSRTRTSRRGAWLGGGKHTRSEVSEPDVARVISKWTGEGFFYTHTLCVCVCVWG